MTMELAAAWVFLISGALAAIASAVVSVLNRRQIAEVHKLSNGNFTAVKDELAFVRSQLMQSRRVLDTRVRNKATSVKPF